MRYHINPEKGPMKCRAVKVPCPYGKDAPHFDSKEDADQAFESLLESEVDPLQSLKSSRVDPKVQVTVQEFTPELKELDERLSVASFEELLEFSGSSVEAHEELDRLISARAASSPVKASNLEAMNPYNEDATAPITRKNFNILKKDWNSYRNSTAQMVDAHVQSKFYDPSYVDLPEDMQVGTAVAIDNYEVTDIRWHEARIDSVGGSDVGMLVVKDFTPEDDQTGFDKFKFGRLERFKVEGVSQALVDSMNDQQEVKKEGALYRGTVWEDRIREGYAADHPELTVYRPEKLYCKKDKTWARINIDGLVSDRPDGVPNGVLECKTGVPSTWENGIPLAYRGQVLYYLEVTELDYADIRAVLNDGEVRDYRLYADSEVAPGSGVRMKEYLTDRVQPWFEGLQALR